MPTDAHRTAAAPSRIPQPAIVTGISIVMRTGATRGRRPITGVSTPIARAAITYMAR
jgi:hypothetical protein